MLVGAGLRLRARMKKRYRDSGLQSYWVADTCCALAEATGLMAPERAVALKRVGMPGGVHFTPQGYYNFALSIVSSVQALDKKKVGKDAVLTLVSGSGKRHHWRGFNSPVGSRIKHSSCSLSKSARAKPQKPTPYQRKRGGSTGSADGACAAR